MMIPLKQLLLLSYPIILLFFGKIYTVFKNFFLFRVTVYAMMHVNVIFRGLCVGSDGSSNRISRTFGCTNAFDTGWRACWSAFRRGIRSWSHGYSKIRVNVQCYGYMLRYVRMFWLCENNIIFFVSLVWSMVIIIISFKCMVV